MKKALADGKKTGNISEKSSQQSAATPIRTSDV
jgi:hypothetical protein